ncbi:MAG: PaaI family thioesterase [Planctomycetes bacterium]|nr:PaaI family thioesterase [Planctomycetota bacterium]
MNPHDEFDRAPVNRLLGMRLVESTAERSEVHLPVRDELLQEAGVVQGGVLTALADTAAVYLLWPRLGDGRTMTGTGCSMQFLAAARPGMGDLVAVATPLRIGRTMAVCESEVRQDGRLVAKGTFPFLLQPRPATGS